MLVKVEKKIGREFVGDFECAEVPALGDCFTVKDQGPHRVVDRTWHFPIGHKTHAATLLVEECE